ncbi:MAG: hypothetical protein ACYTF1_04670 [Planctomycetota bacterium]|jgi:hypothetical protein
MSDMRTLQGILIFFAVGAAVGLLFFTPIAMAEAFRTSLARLIWPYSSRVQWYVSLLMAAAMGYIFASVRHDAFDRLTAAAFILVFLGAMAKVVMDILFGQNKRSTA